MIITFISMGESVESAKTMAGYHGYREGHTKFSKLTVIKPEDGGPMMLKCHNCKKEWPAMVGVLRA